MYSLHCDYTVNHFHIVFFITIGLRLPVHVSPLSLCICSRAAIEAATSQNDPHLPTVEDFKWRVDVAISTR